jgi:branched-chain amino acid transport system permease protein
MSAMDTAIAAAAPVRRRYLWAGILVAAVVAIVWPLIINEGFLLHIAILVLLYSIGAASLHLIIRMGQLSLCHAAFMGLGGYTSALLTTRAELPFIVAFVASFLVPAGAALIVGPILLRLKGVFFVLITFTFGEIVRMTLNDWQSLTGGADGIFRIPPPHPFLAPRLHYYYFALVMAVLCVGAVASLLRSPFGRVIDSIREGDRLAESSGVPVFRFKVMTFVIACGLVGLQGSLQAHYIRYLSPNAYTFLESLNFIIMNVIGGVNSLVGPLIGAIFLTSLPEFLRGWVEYQRFLYGVILVLVMLYAPGGLVELARRLGRRR